MKKQIKKFEKSSELKKLQLEKKVISNFNLKKVKGGVIGTYTNTTNMPGTKCSICTSGTPTNTC